MKIYTRIAYAAIMPNIASTAIQIVSDNLKIEAILEQLDPSTLMSKGDFEILVHSIEPQYSERSIFWLLSKLKNMGILRCMGKNVYNVSDEMNGKHEYCYSHSDIMIEVVQKIKEGQIRMALIYLHSVYDTQQSPQHRNHFP